MKQLALNYHLLLGTEEYSIHKNEIGSTIASYGNPFIEMLLVELRDNPIFLCIHHPGELLRGMFPKSSRYHVSRAFNNNDGVVGADIIPILDIKLENASLRLR